MNTLSECRLFHHTLMFDDVSKKSPSRNVKFKRAFQFLQLLCLQRVYGIDAITRSPKRRPSKPQNQFEVFLGGSCNPTTWRYEQAIPYFQSHSISYYNPQSANWTPDLIEVEHRAKEVAPLLFFVIDHSTRSLAAIVELCYLAARERKIIVVMNSMPEDKNQLKFIEEKNSSNETDNEKDYENVCQARNISRRLLQYINVPIFDNIRIALECSAYLLETTKDECDDMTKSSVGVRPRKTIFELSDDFDNQRIHFRPTPFCTKTQVSSTINESDDDGYRSFNSSNYTLSRSASSVLSDFHEYQYENNHLGFYRSASIWYNLTSSFTSLVNFPITSDLSTTQSLFTVCTLPFRFIRNILLPSMTSEEEIIHFNPSIHVGSNYLFDLYIASGNHDEYWLNTCALPLLAEINVKYTKRQTYDENDQLDSLYDIHIRKQTRLLYYLINDIERLSHLITELAFLIGERKYHIIIYFQPTIDENSETILTAHERKDLERSRKYLADIARKENISLYESREQSWQHVLAFFLHD